MIDTTASDRPGRLAGTQHSARILRRAQGAAVVSEPRLQLAFDRSTGDYCLAML
jgi:hypothetical protein